MNSIYTLITIYIVVFCANNAHSYTAIPLSDFYDVIKHWHDQHDGITGNAYQPDQIVEIANNLLLYQRNNGGWPTNKNPIRRLSKVEIVTITKNKEAKDASLDNRNTYPQIRYLAATYKQTLDKRFSKAAERGLDYILNNQYTNGGWAHSPPRTDAYYGHITFMDEVMPGVLRLLRDITENQKTYNFISEQKRAQCLRALEKGEKLLLDLQIKVNNVPTVWAGQYDRHSLQPTTGRSYELPALVSWESVAVVRYLMSIKHPSPRIIDAIENAVTWFKEVKINGIKTEKIKINATKFKYHTSNYDLQVVKDKTAPPIWARFYDLKTNKPFFANRDGSKVSRLSEVKPDRRTGYSWYGYWPSQLVNIEYPEWVQRTK